jgi:hypothetical protein
MITFKRARFLTLLSYIGEVEGGPVTWVTSSIRACGITCATLTSGAARVAPQIGTFETTTGVPCGESTATGTRKGSRPSCRSWCSTRCKRFLADTGGGKGAEEPCTNFCLVSRYAKGLCFSESFSPEKPINSINEHVAHVALCHNRISLS